MSHRGGKLSSIVCRATLLVSLPPLVTACTRASPHVREPAPQTHRVGQEIESKGVYIQAEVDAWPGSRASVQTITPLRVVVRNEGAVPVAVQYRHIALVTPDGRELRALHPHMISNDQGGAPAFIINTDKGVLNPEFRCHGFSINPVYAEIFPDLDTNRYGLGYSVKFSDSSTHYWREPVPTRRVRQLAIPEGTLDPGGEIEGFVYFERLPDQLRAVCLRFRTFSSATGELLGTTTVPFRVRHRYNAPEQNHEMIVCQPSS